MTPHHLAVARVVLGLAAVVAGTELALKIGALLGICR